MNPLAAYKPNLILFDNGDGVFNIHDPSDVVVDAETNQVLSSSQVLERSPELSKSINLKNSSEKSLKLGFLASPHLPPQKTIINPSLKLLGIAGALFFCLGILLRKSDNPIDPTSQSFVIYASTDSDSETDFEEGDVVYNEDGVREEYKDGEFRQTQRGMPDSEYDQDIDEDGVPVQKDRNLYALREARNQESGPFLEAVLVGKVKGGVAEKTEAEFNGEEDEELGVYAAELVYEDKGKRHVILALTDGECVYSFEGEFLDNLLPNTEIKILEHGQSNLDKLRRDPDFIVKTRNEIVPYEESVYVSGDRIQWIRSKTETLTIYPPEEASKEPEILEETLDLQTIEDEEDEFIPPF